jgi:MSHA type pilus biogenesis protein MshL
MGRTELITIGVLCLSGCQYSDQIPCHDPYLNLSKEDYQTALTKSFPPLSSEPLRPQFDEVPNKSWPDSFYKTVSLSTNDAVPVKEIILSLAQQAQINVILAPDIKGTAVVHAQKRPFIDLLQELCDSHGLRVKLSQKLIKIDVDKPYLATYPVEFLILTRSHQNRFSVATDVFTSSDSRQKDDENSSNTLLTAETKTDFWQEFIENLNVLLSTGDPSQNEKGSSPRYSIHKQGGILAIFATQQQHNFIKAYLDLLRQSVEQQVLIEAKIVEVHLKDEFKSGINWDVMRDHFLFQAALGSVATVGRFDKRMIPERNVFTIGGESKDITGLLSLLSRFGTVRTLSNPRLTVINNQSAVLKVATNKVYFKLNYTTDYNYFDKREQVYVSSDAKTVPIGLVMVVHPCIRQEDGRIIMTLRPTISRVIQEVPDPAVGIASHQKQASFVPEVQVRELDSVFVIDSGETIVVGGLMEERVDNNTSQIPAVSDLPFIGTLFEGCAHERQIIELVIFLRAVVLNRGVSKPTLRDQGFYNMFTQGPLA